MADTTDPNDSSFRPIVWTAIPVFILLFISFTGLMIYVRRRRRRSPDYAVWYRGRSVFAPDGGVSNVPRERQTRHRRGLWGMRSEEGLNELGEAPPPYYGQKKLVDGDNRDSTASAGEGATELRDLEAGERPPEYPAEPPPALITDSRRTGGQ